MKSIIILFLVAFAAFPLFASGQEGPWVITTDYSVFGRVESFAPTAPWTVTCDLALIPGDAVGRHHDGLVYIVGRGGANLIRIHDPANGFELVREFSLGPGRNPQDIAFDTQGRAFVSCYDEAVLLIVDTEAGVVEQTISTAAYADSDGLPETAWMMIYDNRLYVTCQKLARGNWYTPSGPGQLLVLDLDNLQWQAPVQLVGANPYTKIRLTDQGQLLVGCAGYWALLDGGIEVVNPATNLSEGFLTTEQDLGGDLLNFDLTGDGTLHALTNSPSNVTRISRFDQEDGTIVSIVTSAGYDLVDLAWDGDFQLYVADRKITAPGLRVFDSVSGVELTGSTVNTCLPPFQFILPEDDGISSTPWTDALNGSLNLGLPSPNPCNLASDLEIQDFPDQLVRISVFDLRGHLVQKTDLRTDANGRASYRFTGHDSRGSALAAGLYRVVAQSPGGFAARSLTLVK